MITRDQWRKFIDSPVVEWTIFAVGVLLIVLSPLAGAIPGPGGIFVFALGLAMVLKTSMWAKRHYVRLKRKQPKIGRWTDWGLRRRSAFRREQVAKEQVAAAAADSPGGGEPGLDGGDCEPPAPEQSPKPAEEWPGRN